MCYSYMENINQNVKIMSLMEQIITKIFSGIFNKILKVGSCSFECIIFLLIYFLNCQTALFTRK